MEERVQILVIGLVCQRTFAIRAIFLFNAVYHIREVEYVWTCKSFKKLAEILFLAVAFIVAPHEWWHYIFIRFWKVPLEGAILFAGFRPCSSQNQFVSGLVRLVKINQLRISMKYLQDFLPSK